ncbi:hypothetical protein KVT40_005718 [Elsinoe batatas]|uniref:Uncharacterized protein n=1 Tax=Elsinoe batatas TaxID=2601811 RepID=A0A8K0PGV4_9PEZI|nr:hypothetical protein KVT40_005718 [Elsinoe batatas]
MTISTTRSPAGEKEYDPHRRNESVCSVCSSTIVKPLDQGPPSSRVGALRQKFKDATSKIHDQLDWTPPTSRWNTNKPPKFTLYLNLVFAWATAVSAANLYYTHPMLDVLAREFRVGEDAIAQVPMVIQAGYAIGLFTLCPLGDVSKRRPLVLRLSFLTVTPQLMFPLVGDLAPPTCRAAAISIVTSGLMLGQLLACLTADYPSTNPSGLSYPQNLLSMLRLLTTKPVLAQACTASFFTASPFSLLWTTLVLLLTGPRYAYPNTTVGLFALAVLLPVLLSPVFGRKVIDPHVPLFSVLLSQGICLVAILIGTFTGRRTIVGLIIRTALGDFGNQMSQTAWRSGIFSIDPKARNRVNTALMTFVFAGQMTGTAVGSVLYGRFGWEGSGGYSIGAIVVALVVGAGGWSVKKANKGTADGRTVEREMFTRSLGEGRRSGTQREDEVVRSPLGQRHRGALQEKQAEKQVLRTSDSRLRPGGLAGRSPRESRWKEDGLVDVPLNSDYQADDENERSTLGNEDYDTKEDQEKDQDEEEERHHGSQCDLRAMASGTQTVRGNEHGHDAQGHDAQRYSA